MASLELRNERYRLVFVHGGKKYGYSLKTKDKDHAEALKGGAEKTLMLIEQQLLSVPEGADIVSFVQRDGKADQPAAREKPKDRSTLRALRDRYVTTHANGAMETNSLATARMHLNHFIATFGADFPLTNLSLAKLQEHVDRRAKKRYRRRQLSPVTLRKEVASFRAAWNWGVEMGLVSGRFPNRGLKFPKTDEKPPFQTWAEIDRVTARGGLSEPEEQLLWDCLYLTLPEVGEFLAFVQTNATQPFLYPMVCFAAHTGCRRSEVVRVRLQDLDLESGTVRVQEKKRSREKRTIRTVPLSPFLIRVLDEWLAIHPGGQNLFCQLAKVMRSKTKRSAPLPITRNEAHDHFKRTTAGSKWKRLRGWHALRHSFASNAAAANVDQRLIDEWMGHQTEEQRKRYRHLFPSTQNQAIRSVFGAE